MFSKGFQKKGRIPTIAGVAFPTKESLTDANISRRHFSRPFVLFLLLAHTRLELPARQQRTVVDSFLNILFGPLKRFWVVFCWFLFHLSVPRTWVLFLACWHTSAASASAAAAAPTDMYPSVKWQHICIFVLFLAVAYQQQRAGLELSHFYQLISFCENHSWSLFVGIFERTNSY